jgi:Fe-S oxidoreductase
LGAGSFDDRAKKITKAFVRILNRANVPFAVLGTEELYWRSCKKSWK